ncbi:MAG TPA: alpha/beta hydrolase [bacterium]|jgi:acetyl esterase/lipase|nr:alpha/beta hydrolase [bacterium]
MQRIVCVLLAIGLVLALSDSALPEEAVQVATTIAYVSGAAADPIKQTLDLYRPRARKNLPVLLFFHGGVWQMGDKGQYQHIGAAFARRGILTAVVNYRLTPSVRHPDHVGDAARAVAWAIRHAADYGGRPDRVFLSGHSAGGHLVTLLLFDRRYLKDEGLDADALAGVIPLSGIFDLTQPIDDTPEGGTAVYIHPPFGTNRRTLEAASPIRRLRATRVPMLVILAGEDYRAMQGQSRRFVEAARQRGLPVTFETIARRAHFDLVNALGNPGDPTTDLVARFVLGPQASGKSRAD